MRIFAGLILAFISWAIVHILPDPMPAQIVYFAGALGGCAAMLAWDEILK